MIFKQKSKMKKWKLIGVNLFLMMNLRFLNFLMKANLNN